MRTPCARSPAHRGAAASAARAAALAAALRWSGVGPVGVSADGGLCPKGHFHSTELSFECGKQETSGYLHVDLATDRGSFDVPYGVADGRFTFKEGGRGVPSQVAIVDPKSNATLATFDATNASQQEAKLIYSQNGSSSTWVVPSASTSTGHSAIVAMLTRGSGTETQLAFQSALVAAVHIRLVYNASAGPPPVPGQSRPRSNVSRNITAEDFTNVAFSYNKDKECDKPALDCLVYDALAAREAVYNWSAWVASVYPDAKAAWQDLCPDFPQEMPLHWWQAVWSRWPESNMSTVPWQAAFQYIDTLQSQDRRINFGEFSTAFDLAAVGLSIYSWCIQLHRYHKTAAEAWGAVHGKEDLNFARWQSVVWPSFDAPDNFNKATTASSFGFVDASSSGVVTEEEFMNIWGECHNSYDPTSSNTATTSRKTVFDTSTSTGQEEDEWATNDSLLFGNCCHELRAACLACQANRSVVDFCSVPALSRVPGCWSHTAEGGPEDFRGAGCPFQGYAYGPAMKGTDATHEDGPGPCQARCASSPGCSYFSFWWLDGACVVHDKDAQWSPARDAMSGPAVCMAEVVTHIDDIDFTTLSDDQKSGLQKSFLAAFAKVANLTVQDVTDVAGVAGAVTLSQGSLVITNRVKLPAGRAFSNFSMHTRDGLAGELVSALTSAKIERRSSGMQGITVTTRRHTECFLTGTKYQAQPVAATDANAEIPFASSVKASSTADCQVKCNQTEGCDSFTFSTQDGGCSMLGGPVVSQRDANSIAGPRACPPLPYPQVYEMGGGGNPVWAALDGAAQGVGLHDQGKVPRSWMLFFIMLFCFGALMFCAFSLVVRLFYAKKKKRRDNQPKYMALQCDDKSEDGEGASDEDRGDGQASPTNDSRGAYVRSTMEPDSLAGRRKDQQCKLGRSVTPRCARAFLGPEVLSHRRQEAEQQQAQKDGSLSEALFNKIDTNKDGLITRKEWEQAMHSDRNGNYGRGSPAPPG